MSHFIKKLITTFCCIYILQGSYLLVAQIKDPRLVRLEDGVQNLNTRYVQQKIFIEFNQSYYTSADKILIKAYVLNYSALMPDTVSTNLYIEMIDSKKKLNYISILRLENGVGIQQIDLKDTIKAGVYKFRAFTNWARNFDQDFFFERYILIAPTAATNGQIQTYKPEKKKENSQYKIFSEGGNFVYNLTNYCLIKDMVNHENAHAILTDDLDNKVCDISIANGIGNFSFIPEENKTYKVKFDSKNYKDIVIPSFVKYGYILHVDIDPNKNEMVLNFNSSVNKTNDDYANSIFVLIQSGAKKLYLEKYIIKSKKLHEKIDIQQYPKGLLLISIFDNDLNPIAERLVFNPVGPAEMPDLSMNIQQINDTTFFNFNRNKFSNKLLSIYSSKPINLKQEDCKSSITKYLFFESEIPGFCKKNVFKPNDYHNINLLLIAEKWQRYQWKNVLNNQFPEITYPAENYLVVSGTITRQFIKLPLSNSPVKLTILNEFYFYRNDTTAKDGRFYFDGIDLYDTIKVKIEASRYINDKENVLIDVDNAVLPETDFDKKNPLYAWYKHSLKDKKRLDRKKYLALHEYIDTSKKSPEGSLHSEASYALNSNEINASGYTTPLDMIKGRFPGLYITGSGQNAVATVRGTNSLFGSNEPLYLVDNVQVDRQAFNSISPTDIERIEFLNSSNSAIYGLRGANGALAIYTKQGNYVLKGKIIFDMLGYQNIKPKNINTINERLYKNEESAWFPIIDKTIDGYIGLKNHIMDSVYIFGVYNGIPIEKLIPVSK